MRKEPVIGLLFFAFFGGILATNAAQSNDLVQEALDKKVRESNVIAIGTTIAVRSDRIPNDVFEYAVLRIDHVVYGQRVPSTIRLVTKGPIPESDPWCCTVGTRLLVFARSDGPFFWAVNGDYGVFVLDGSRVLNWPSKEGDTWADLNSVLGQVKLITENTYGPGELAPE